MLNIADYCILFSLGKHKNKPLVFSVQWGSLPLVQAPVLDSALGLHNSPLICWWCLYKMWFVVDDYVMLKTLLWRYFCDYCSNVSQMLINNSNNSLFNELIELVHKPGKNGWSLSRLNCSWWFLSQQFTYWEWRTELKTAFSESFSN